MPYYGCYYMYLLGCHSRDSLGGGQGGASWGGGVLGANQPAGDTRSKGTATGQVLHVREDFYQQAFCTGLRRTAALGQFLGYSTLTTAIERASSLLLCTWNWAISMFYLFTVSPWQPALHAWIPVQA